MAGRRYILLRICLGAFIDKIIDALLEPSDEEILGYSSESEDDDIPEQADEVASSDEGGAEEEDEDEEGWGSSKKDYYNNDNIETEADALEEEQEARRLQKKRLQKMSEADFGFDELEWTAGNEAKDGDDEGDVVTEVLKDIEITPEMGPKERLSLLQARYPEFDFLANELLELHPLLEDLKQQVASESTTDATTTEPSVTLIKARALAAYVGSLAMYFAILSSPAKSSQALPLNPAELRDHAVMESLLQCRQLWTNVKSLKAPAPAPASTELSEDEQMEDEPVISNGVQSSSDDDKPKPTKKSRKQLAIEATSASLADLDSLLPKRTKKASKPVVFRSDDDDSDFGEETALTAKAAAEKATRRKNLSFYTSQIAQKANKRGEKGREAGGDMDLPHKERLRDRQARLNAEAEARGKKLDEYGRGGKGVALGAGSDSEDDDAGVAKELRGEEDSYYNLISKTSQDKKQAKEEHRAAIRKAKEQNSLLRVVEGEMDEEGKRAIGYVIEKNKGLAPKRRKEVRNPRVKKRMKFEEKKKKLASMRAVYKGGEERGGYGGEKTGIKTGLVKSIKL